MEQTGSSPGFKCIYQHLKCLRSGLPEQVVDIIGCCFHMGLLLWKHRMQMDFTTVYLIEEEC